MSGDLKERIEKIGRLLHGLGEHEDVVAEALNEKGIKGFVESTFSCPIATLIKDEVYPDLALTYETFSVTDENVKTPDGTVPLPTAVSRFITRFDEGDYPDLNIGADEEEED